MGPWELCENLEKPSLDEELEGGYLDKTTVYDADFLDAKTWSDFL